MSISAKGKIGLRQKKDKVIIIGITGGLGTGKTSTAGVFKSLGAASLDADRMAHAALKKNTASYKRIVRAFGSSILDRYGKINRTRLATLTFGSKKALKKLCDIIHPIVLKKIREKVNRIKSSGCVPAVVIDAPLLIETNLHKIADCLIVVKTSRRVQIDRAMEKTGLTLEEVKRRIKSQMPLSKKIKMADHIIDNEGRKSDMKKMIKKIWEEMKSDRK